MPVQDSTTNSSNMLSYTIGSVSLQTVIEEVQNGYILKTSTGEQFVFVNEKSLCAFLLKHLKR